MSDAGGSGDATGIGEDDIVVRRDEDVLEPVRGPVRLGETLGAVVDRRRWGERLRGAAIHGRWSEIVGSELAQRCEPVRLAGGILVVRTASATWATQIGYLSGSILERAQAIVGEDLVREIRVTVGPLGNDARDGA